MATYYAPDHDGGDIHAEDEHHCLVLTEVELLELARLVDVALRRDPVVLTHAPEVLLSAASDVIHADTIARRNANPKD